MDLAVAAIAFGAIFVVELPDKTFIAALVLSTRYRPLQVWLGVGAAFLVQTLIAVTVGKAVTYLPHEVVLIVAAAIFVLGAAMLVREAPAADRDEPDAEAQYAAKAAADRTGLRAATTCFLVIFAAEWGDLSQLLTISMVGRYHHPVSVFVGAWAALLTVSGLAIIVGRFLLRHVRLSLIHYAGALVCAVLAVVTIAELLK
ncbi:MAG TPA: TMEM165/GDT1 family protein [Marmoricola sp.]